MHEQGRQQQPRNREAEESEAIEALRHLKGELSACHKSYRHQIKIVQELKHEIRVLVEADDKRARLIEDLYYEVRDQEPRIEAIIAIVEKLHTIVPERKKTWFCE